MGGSGSFPVDLVLFGMIAAFLVLRLRSILGRRGGFERPAQAPRPAAAPAAQVIDARAEPAATPTRRDLPDPGSQLGQALQHMRQVERSFDPARFLSGAEAAFHLIVTAFAQGNRQELRPLLSDDTYRAFESAIAAREMAHEVHRTEIRSIESAAIIGAHVSETGLASITVRIVSDQINVTISANGLPSAGTESVTEITDVWTFERQLNTPDPSWRLVSAASA